MSYRKIFHLKVVKVSQSSKGTLKLSVVGDTNFSPFIICQIEFGSKANKHTPVATSQEYFPSFSERHRRWNDSQKKEVQVLHFGQLVANICTQRLLQQISLLCSFIVLTGICHENQFYRTLNKNNHFFLQQLPLQINIRPALAEKLSCSQIWPLSPPACARATTG